MPRLGLPTPARVKETKLCRIISHSQSFPVLHDMPSAASRVHLRPGESRTVQFTLKDRDLSYVNESGTRLIGAG